MDVRATSGGTDMKGTFIRLADRDRTGSRSDPLPLGAARGWHCDPTLCLNLPARWGRASKRPLHRPTRPMLVLPAPLDIIAHRQPTHTRIKRSVTRICDLPGRDFDIARNGSRKLLSTNSAVAAICGLEIVEPLVLGVGISSCLSLTDLFAATKHCVVLMSLSSKFFFFFFFFKGEPPLLHRCQSHASQHACNRIFGETCQSWGTQSTPAGG